MLVNQAAVLVSGGMDSMAALHWAKERYPELLAISYDYGQKNRDAELTVAQRECEALGVTMLRERLLAFSTTGILGKTIPAHREHGTSPAMNVGRNPLLFTYAVTHACQHFPNGNLDLVIGCNIEDRVAFPDCEAPCWLKGQEFYRHAFARHITVVGPWLDRTKAQIIGQASPVVRAAIARSWSCYDGNGPCGTCTACVLRAKAFAATGLEDWCTRPKMHGGDAHRDAAFGQPIPVFPADDRSGG